ncbi:serine/threonine-protein kinase [Tautonia rosea]|uniref:serine/threonine-protein kinase n=1 Tax=Tautonia rosea TaxID=2728037 RepID=UPI001474018E|nr:serine/threonine-protein kinase [Tautonia rosea]
MPVTVRCPNPSCERINRFDPSLAGQTVRCPICGARFSLAEAPPIATAVGRPGSAETQELTTLVNGAEQRARPDREMPRQVGRYEIKREIGSGAFGAVYCAYDPQLDRDVALKVPHPGVLEAPSAVERFLREARAAGKLRHGHIVPVFDAGQDDQGHDYIASAYVPGSTLAELLIDGPLPARRAAEIIADLAEALEHAHDLGIVHRDIKPSNLLIDASGQVLIADFGLAQHRGPSQATITEVGTIMGTPGYMAPEVAAGINGDVPPASDQYSLAVVLFELLCGRRPFQGPSHVVIYRKLEEPPPSPRQFHPDLSPTLDAICLRALSRKPEDRFPTIGEFAMALRSWLDSGDDPPKATEPNRWFSASSSSRHAPVTAFQDPEPRDPPAPLPKPEPSRRRTLPTLSPALWTALVTLGIWGLIILGVVLIMLALSGDS